MNENFEDTRKTISVVLILLAIMIIAMMAVSILSNKSKINEVNKLEEESKNNTDTTNYIITEDGIKENTSRQIKEDQIVKYLIISNTKIISENGTSKLTAEILNRAAETNDLKIKITFLGNDSKVIAEKEFEVGNININETKSISIELQEDVLNAYSVKYEILE